MKKFLLLAALFAAVFTTTASFAQGGDPQEMRQRMAERMKPQLIEKEKITDGEADKVLDIYVGTMQERREIRMDNGTSEDDKKKKTDALNEETAKKYKAIPLKDEQVKAVTDYFEEMRKNMRRPGGN